MTLGYYAGRYSPETKVRVTGQRHAKAGEVGEIVGADPVDPHRFRVRIGREVFVIQGKNLEEVKIERENL